MGYVGPSIAEALPGDDDLVILAHQIVDAVGDDLKDRVERKTPVAKLPPAYHGDLAAYIGDRGGRVPGTLKGSWVKGPVKPRANLRFEIEVFTEDEVAPYVEDDTVAHPIRARKARTLRYPQGLTFRYRKSVKHPGTTGVGMMANSLVEVELAWQPVAQEEVQKWAADLFRAR